MGPEIRLLPPGHWDVRPTRADAALSPVYVHFLRPKALPSQIPPWTAADNPSLPPGLDALLARHRLALSTGSCLQSPPATRCAVLGPRA